MNHLIYNSFIIRLSVNFYLHSFFNSMKYTLTSVMTNKFYRGYSLLAVLSNFSDFDRGIGFSELKSTLPALADSSKLLSFHKGYTMNFQRSPKSLMLKSNCNPNLFLVFSYTICISKGL